MRTDRLHEDKAELALALDRPASHRSLWLDIVMGVGAAWDTLPARSRPKFCRNDQAAFSTDIAKLVHDRQIVERFIPVAPGDVEFEKRPKNAHGQTSSAFVEAD